MRLLKVEDNGEFSLLEFIGNNVPPYAILSHTWGADHDEVTLDDLAKGTEKMKQAGYKKFLFCRKQAANDHLKYVWIDTCCIDKSSSAELAEAINSMFRWYYEAAKCYVYLSDVSTGDSVRNDPLFQQIWEQAFQNSRWFTRGWTLQELLAPKSVDFFSAEGEQLGSRVSLLQEIHKITKIQTQALQGNPLPQFSIDERMSWATSRKTKREEDSAYCLLGIFDIHMPLIYGEGRQKALSRLLKEIWESSNDGSPALPSTLSTVPYVRNPDFVDRPNILAWIREKGAAPTGRAALVGQGGLGRPSSRVALVGVGGVGKSQIAIEYAYSISGHLSTLILWVYAGSKAGLEQSYRDIADANRVPGRDQPEGDILELVRKWLRTECQTPWVLILDNVDDRSMAEYVDKFIPQNGFVLITSRSEDAAAYLVGDYTNILIVGSMENEKALSLLRKKLRREIEWDDGKASDLVRALDCIPLAVSQAAAFLNDKAPKYTLSRYLDEIKGEGETVGFLEKAYRDLWRDSTDFEQANSVVLTWHKSFRSIQAERPTAAALLSVLSFFVQQEIPEILVHISGVRSHRLTFYGWWPSNRTIYGILIAVGGIIATVSYLGIQRSLVILLLAILGVFVFLPVASIPTQAYQELLKILRTTFESFYQRRSISTDDIDEDISLLKKYAFLSQDVKSNGYQMHRLVQLSMRKWLEARGRFTRTKEVSLLAILETMPTPDQEDWIRSRSLLPHAEAILGFAPFRKTCLLPYTNLYNTTAYYSRVWKGQQALQETVNTAAIRTQKLFYPKDVLALNCGFSLSWLFMADGKYNEATKWARRVLEGREMILGPTSLDTLSAYSSLAEALRYQGKYQEAEQISRKAREGFKATLGIDHSKTQKSNNILALILLLQGQHTEAEKLFLELVNAQKRVLGEQHPSTLTSKGNLALTFWNQGRWKEAEELFVQVMETSSRVLGEEHPDTLISKGNLASTFWNQGRWKEAEELEVQVIETSSRVLGEEHPDTLTSMANLASTFSDQGRWKEAEELEVQVIETRSRVLGEEHPSTLTSMANLASTFLNQGRWKEAEELFVQVIEISSRVLGEEHPDTLTSKGNLALTFSNQGRWKEAEELFVQVIEISSRVLGEEHPSTLISKGNLALTFWNQGRWKEAEELEVQVIETRSRVLGEEHPDTLTGMANLASTFWNQGRWKEAEELEVQVMETRSRVLGEEHPDTLNSIQTR